MADQQKRLIKDLVFVAISICVAVYIGESEIFKSFLFSLGAYKYLGAFIAGIFFTSVFTTAPAILILGELATVVPLPALAVLGGLGAVLGDYIIFYFVRDRFAEDLGYLMNMTKGKRFPKIFKTKLFKFFLPFVGALIIASPIPDEVGIAMLGLSDINNKSFLIISFIMNTVGVLLIGWIARSVIAVV